jgi:2'-5' RNA ligase
MLLDIVILPPAELREKIGKRIREAAREIPSVFVVDNNKLIPHLSLFHLRTTQGRIKKLELRIKRILKKYRPILIKSSKVELSHVGSGVVFIKTSSNQVLRQLRAEVFNSCYPLRTGMMPWMPRSRKPTRLEIQARKRYGIHFSFYPHITAAMLRDAKYAPKMASKLKEMKFEFLADTIAIAEVNFWHQVTRVIKKFRF